MRIVRKAASALGGALFFATAVGLASAADLPMKAIPRAPAMAAPPWSGFYVGAHFGYGFGLLSTSNAPADLVNIDSDFLGMRGVTGGALGGYNWLFSPRFLVGIEGDVSWSNIKFVLDTPGFGTQATIRQDQAYSVRARAGVLLTPYTLLYGAVGWASGEFDISTNVFGPVLADSRWFRGIQGGMGIETNFGGGWGGRFEYLHTHYQSASFNLGGAPLEIRPSVGVGRAALIYRFAQGGPTPWTGNMLPTPWTGVYAGGTIGAAAAVGEVTAPGIGYADGAGVIAVIPTGLLGANLQVTPQWVIGVEGEAAPAISVSDLDVDWWAGIRGRGGYLFTPNNLIYGTLGWVTSGIKTTSLINGVVAVPSQRINALSFGGGIESALDPNWRVRFDYQYADARSLDILLSFPTFSALQPVEVRPSWHVGRIGLVYLFR